MKYFKLLALTIIIGFLSCSDKEKTIEGIWVLETSVEPIDTVTIKKIKDQTYRIESRFWKNDKPRMKSTTGVLDNETLTFDNGKTVKIDFDKMVANGTKYIKLK